MDPASIGSFLVIRRDNIGDLVCTLPAIAALRMKFPAARIEVTCVYTNQIPGGNARAPGQPQVCFAAESHMDIAARELGIDPLVLRERNAIRAHETDVLGAEWHDSEMSAVLGTLRREMRWNDKPAHGRGRGIGCVDE